MLHVRLLLDRVHILVQGLEQDRQEFLGIMLLEAHELTRFLGNDALYVPRRNVFGIPNIHFLDQIRVSNRQLAFGAVHARLIQVEMVNLKKEVFHDVLRVRDALQNRIHEAGVPQVLEAYKTPF